MQKTEPLGILPPDETTLVIDWTSTDSVYSATFSSSILCSYVRHMASVAKEGGTGHWKSILDISPTRTSCAIIKLRWGALKGCDTLLGDFFQLTRKISKHLNCNFVGNTALWLKWEKKAPRALEQNCLHLLEYTASGKHIAKLTVSLIWLFVKSCQWQRQQKTASLQPDEN